MIHIAICDDEKDFVQHLTGLIEHYSKESGEQVKVKPQSVSVRWTEA